MKQRITYENFVQLLVESVPELKKDYQEHLEYHKEILPHVFLGDIFWNTCRNIKNISPEFISKLLNFLDKANNSSDSKVQDLVGVSFLEYLMNPSKNDLPIIYIREQLPENLTKELKKMENWKPSYKINKL